MSPSRSSERHTKPQDGTVNQSQTDGSGGASADGTTGWTPDYRHPGYNRRQVSALQRRVQELERELAWKERKLESVTRQYERRLAERDRQLETRNGGDDSHSLDTLRRLFGLSDTNG